REQPAHARSRHRAGPRGAGGGGRRRGRRQSAAAGRRVASDGDRAHGGGAGVWGPARAARVSAAGGPCHDVPNLYVVDGSTIVTCAGVNPTSTIQAVALYIADGMIPRRAGGGARR